MNVGGGEIGLKGILEFIDGDCAVAGGEWLGEVCNGMVEGDSERWGARRRRHDSSRRPLLRTPKTPSDPDNSTPIYCRKCAFQRTIFDFFFVVPRLVR
jgi:hypothetical protein